MRHLLWKWKRLLSGGTGGRKNTKIYFDSEIIKGNIDNYVDVRTGDIEEFIEANKENVD